MNAAVSIVKVSYFIRSILDRIQCTGSLRGSPITNRKINVAYNNIARYVFNIKRFDHTSIYSKEMLSMSLNNFLNFRTITLIHKIISDKEPTYLYHKLTSKSNRINHIIYKKYKYLLSERQFIPFATRIWNSLPTNIRNIGNHLQYK